VENSHLFYAIIEYDPNLSNLMLMYEKDRLLDYHITSVFSISWNYAVIYMQINRIHSGFLLELFGSIAAFILFR